MNAWDLLSMDILFNLCKQTVLEGRITCQIFLNFSSKRTTHIETQNIKEISKKLLISLE